jgi:hypothetical protein
MKIEIERDGVVFLTADVVEKWNVLNVAQWIAVMDYIRGKRKRLGYEKFVLWRLRSLMGPFLDKKERAKLQELDVIALGDMATAMAWISDTPPNHYQSFYRGWLWWKAPKEKLSGAAMKEYLLVSSFIQLWASGVRDNDAKKIMLGLNGAWAAGMRWRGCKWSNTIADVNMKIVRLVPVKHKMYCLYNWWGLTLWLRELYPEVFDGDDDDEGARVTGPRALLVNLAGEKFGGIKQVERADLHDVMTYMRICAVERIKLKNK